MAFVSEEIAAKKDVAYFNSFGFKDVLDNPAEPCWWAIDRDRNIFLFPQGGGAFEIPETYGLYIDGDLIEIEVREWSEGSEYDHTLKVHWIINKIKAPDGLVQKGYRQEEIRQIIEDAFLGLGTTGISPESILETTVKITAEAAIYH